MKKTNLKNDTKKTDWTRTRVGIDYSLTSPAVHIDDIKTGTFNFHYLTNKKKWTGKIGENIYGYEHKEWKDPIERFTYISDFVMDLLSNYIRPQIFIEGYSFGSKGQGLFQIAENCGILKYRLLQETYGYNTVVPSVVKKGATGKGNADKDMMYEAFVKELPDYNLKKLFDTEKVGNPISDIVDSYYIKKVGYDNLLCS